MTRELTQDLVLMQKGTATCCQMRVAHVLELRTNCENESKFSPSALPYIVIELILRMGCLVCGQMQLEKFLNRLFLAFVMVSKSLVYV